MAIPQFVNAEELSLNLQKHGIEITARRLTDLADHYQMPHTRCDCGPPLFRKQDAKDWIAANLLAEHSRRRMPTSLSVIDPHSMGGFVGGVPTSLVGMTEWLREFPLGLLNEAACIYFLVKGDQVVYVGKSDVLTGRLATHRKEKDFDRALFLRVPADDASAIELAFIKLLRPRYNSEREKMPVESRIAEYHGHTSRYMRAIGVDGAEPTGEESTRLLAVIDRLEHDHKLERDTAVTCRDNGASLKRLLRRILGRLESSEAFDANSEQDRQLTRDIRNGLAYSYSMDDEWLADTQRAYDARDADKDPAQ